MQIICPSGVKIYDLHVTVASKETVRAQNGKKMPVKSYFLFFSLLGKQLILIGTVLEGFGVFWKSTYSLNFTVRWTALTSSLRLQQKLTNTEYWYEAVKKERTLPNDLRKKNKSQGFYFIQSHQSPQDAIFTVYKDAVDGFKPHLEAFYKIIVKMWKSPLV